MRKLLKGKITILASLLLVLAACGAPSPDAEAAATQPDRVVEIDLNEFTIEANSFEFAAGETVEFVVTNSGEIEHELRLSNQARVNAHLEGGHDDHEDSMSGEEIPHKDDEAPHEDDETAGVEAAHEDDETAGVEAAHEDDETAEVEAAHEDDETAEVDAAHDEGDDHAVADAVLVLGAGETGTLVFTFPDNDHDFTAAVCLLPGHYEAGMATDLTVDA